MRVWRFTVLLAVVLALMILLATPALSEQRVALVIGNATYAHAPRLANPLNDAADIGASLARLGFAVTKLENADYATLRQGLLAFTKAASAAEVAVVFYAGHGIEVDQRNFLVPVDAKLSSDQDVEFETVPLELVTRSVARASGLRLVILDACRENPFAASMQRAGATRAIGRGLARVEPAGETLVAYASKEGTVAADGEGRNSPYSEALLSHLEEPGLEVGLMFRKVRDAVLAATGGGQEPFVYGSLSSRGVYLTARLEPEPMPLPAPPVSMSESVTERLTAEELAVERVFWESVKDSANASDFEAYLSHYPQGRFASLARNRLAALQRPEALPALPEAAVEAVEAGLELSRADRRLIQLGLAAEGFDPGPADGLFGRGTRGAIGRWQASHGGVSTGYLDQESAKLLLASGVKREAEEKARGQAEAETEQQRRDEESQATAGRQPKCPEWSSSGKENGPCWREVDNQPGCFIWGDFESVTVDWSGTCNDGVAVGAGILEAGLHIQEGAYVEGKKHGHWAERYQSRIEEGPYVGGVKHGHWVEKHTDGHLVALDDELSSYMLGNVDQAEGSYARGKRHGQWIFRGTSGWMELISGRPDSTPMGHIVEARGSFLDGQRHGQWTFRDEYGATTQGNYVKGMRHGRWVIRCDDPEAGKGIEEGSYLDDKKDGHWVERREGFLGDPTKTEKEGSYVNGQREGRWVTRFDVPGGDRWSVIETCVAGGCN